MRPGIKLPLRSRVGNLEASALGVALGIAACCGDHHSEVASLIEGVAHSFLQQGGLQATPPQLWNGRSASEQRNLLVDAEHASGAGFAIDFGKKARTLLARGKDGAELHQRFPKFWKFVGPAPCAYVGPERGFLRFDDPHADPTLVFCRGLLDRAVKNVAKLDRSVVAGTKQVEGSDAGERAYFMQHGRGAIEKEALDYVQRGGIEFLEDTQPETLGDGGVDAVEGCVGAGALDPLRAAVRVQAPLCLGELDAGAAFGALQTSRKCEIRKHNWVWSWYTDRANNV